MKKSGIMFCGFIIGFIIIQFCMTSNVFADETVFITSYWNTTDHTSSLGLDDWNEAGSVGFSISGYKGNIYVKNDHQNLYLGVLILGELNSSVTWRVNFDIDSDGYWAEDAKELRVIEDGINEYQLEIDDQRYLQGDPIPYSDSQPDDFTAKLRSLEYFGENYSIFELTVPLQSDDLLNDLQVTNPEESIIGVSLDVFNEDLGFNGTWKGNSYPNYANSVNYAQIIFAGPQDRQIPIFQEEPPLVTTTTTEDEDRVPLEGGAADGFELWIGLLSIGFISYTLYWRRRNS
ncbi:MAG: hypothetical protein ACW99R_12425 [Candidatus Hodarchaeales archaeon]|jgi:hypothetical protein